MLNRNCNHNLSCDETICDSKRFTDARTMLTLEIPADRLNQEKHRAIHNFLADLNTTRRMRMPTITTKDGTEIYYKDWGQGQPIVFSHGWPLSADDWDTQMMFFLNHGYRVIAHDRR